MSATPRPSAPTGAGTVGAAGTAGNGSARLGYIPALDGIRALAVAAVVWHHITLIGRERGGWLGVSTFLTLSGFLITTLLIGEAAERGGRIGLLSFWARRYRRLWPAAALNVALILGLVAAARLPSVGVGGDVVSVFTNLTNWRFVEEGRTAPLRLVSPFIPQWSLAVEEQWYLVVPVVVAAMAGRRRPLLMVFGVAVVASTWWSVHADFYLLSEWYRTEIRVAELAAGAALACVLTPAVCAAVRPRVRRAAEVVGWVGVGLTAWWWATVEPTAEWVRTGGFTVVAVASVAVLVGVMAGSGPLARLLAAPPLVWLGRRSYGIYLLHWPIYLVTRSEWFEAHPPVALLVRLGLTLVLAECSLRLWENPIRQGRLLPAPWFGPVVVAVSIVLTLLAFRIGT